jgi:hypothetical protein
VNGFRLNDSLPQENQKPGFRVIFSRRTAHGRLCALFLALVVCCTAAQAQKDTGAIAGTVKDASGPK